MRQRNHIIAAVFMVLSFLSSYGQEVPESTKQQLENLVEVTEEETENDELLQQWNYLKKEPGISCGCFPV